MRSCAATPGAWAIGHRRSASASRSRHGPSKWPASALLPADGHRPVHPLPAPRRRSLAPMRDDISVIIIDWSRQYQLLLQRLAELAQDEDQAANCAQLLSNSLRPSVLNAHRAGPRHPSAAVAAIAPVRSVAGGCPRPDVTKAILRCSRAVWTQACAETANGSQGRGERSDTLGGLAGCAVALRATLLRPPLKYTAR